MARTTRSTPSARPRGIVIVAAAVFIIALTIMVVGTMQAMTSVMVQNGEMSARTELVYAAIGMVHLVKTDLADDGTVSNGLSNYDMDGTNQTYTIDAAWNGTTFRSIQTRYRLAAGPGSGDTTVVGRADRTVNGVTESVEVSAVVETIGGLPYDGYFGNNLSVGAGLTTNTPFGINGDVNGVGTINNGDLVFNGDVTVSGDFNPTATPGGTGSVTDNTDVPAISLDVPALITELTDEAIAGNLGMHNYTKSTAGLPGKGNSDSKGIRLRFDAAYPGKVFISTTNANIHAVNNPFTSEAAYDLQTGPDGTVFLLEQFEYVVVEGTYSSAITVIAPEGAIQLDANLVANPDYPDTPPIGLVAGGAGSADETGNVMVRRKKNGNDYGVSAGGSLNINAAVYAQNKFKGYTAGGNPGKASNINFTGLLVARDGGSDLNEISSNRSFSGPAVGSTLPPGIERDKFATSNPKPIFKTGTWAVDYNPS